ncbi:ATP-grasp domain-containing protein [Pseudomonas sp. CCM 7891]|uniref:ATP-grasp domain-containing protein n=1 Tax=Pseudomonas karstica TaxID=1055468 RepID=A0A7X2UYM1_9PSED|nr:ATP-grasp domain-containing protein [Pseudomonas karstica]MTD20966.1 ATP-grasp domain-containing protein [Pseudomonas karstica]
MIKVVVVDGFSSGKFLAKKLQADGCVLLHVASSSHLDDYYYIGFDLSIYKAVITNENFSSTVSEVKKFKPHVIIAGAESGVFLADELNDAFGLSYCNDFSKTTARRNKYEMIEHLSAAGLPVARQAVVDAWDSARVWIEAHDKFPVVLKPLESAGADGVYICNDLIEAEAAFAKIYGVKNRLNIDNISVLVQEYLVGTEYVVNMVSLGGKQLVTEVVRYKKRLLGTGSIIYDIDEMMPSSSEVYKSLVDYTRQVVMCLGIKNGPSHAEVMLTADGPKLVEVAARTDGILRDTVCAQTTRLGQINAAAMSITDPAAFERLVATDTHYELFQNSYNVCLINSSKGVFSKELFLMQLARLESFFEAVFYAQDGQEIAITKDVFSQPGTVYLVHADLSVIESDYKAIRRMESEAIYLM